MTKSEFIHKIEACVPQKLVLKYRQEKRLVNWKIQQLIYYRILQKIRKKHDPLNVVFLVQYASAWKYDAVYRAMQKDNVFNPIIFVCPLIELGSDEMRYRLLQAVETFTKRGYKVISGLNEKSGKCINLRTLKPDIICYTTLWVNRTHKMYNAYKLRNYLKCYVNYGYCTIADEWGFASVFHGLMWRNFSECEELRQLALHIKPNEMKNFVVTGYPIYDEYAETPLDSSIWKNSSAKYKRIIWAPHHSIDGHDGLLKFSTFLENADVMLQMADEFKDSIQFAFKPHPQLKDALYNHPNWGKKKTDAYYEEWASRENTTLVDGAYINLFKSSDAMIHDCGSFIVEYLYTQKPVLYMANYNREDQSNEVGKKAFAVHYHGYTHEDIERFIIDVVLNGNDTMAEKRQQFYDDILVPPNGLSVAENIINEIKKELHK